MQVYPRKRITKYDIALLILLVILSCALIIHQFLSDGGDCVRVTKSDGDTEIFSLSGIHEHSVTSRGFTLTVCVNNGEVSVTSSDCPDHTCERTAAISKSSQAIVCVPAGIVVEIIGDADNIGENGERNEDFVIG